jgi:hypothetical protein
VTDYGAAKPIADWVNNWVIKPSQKILGAADKVTPQNKEDTSWHDDMVRKANESFQSKPSPAKNQTPSKPTPPKYHKGTDYVPKTGPAILKKGEAVLNEKDAEKHRKEKAMAEKSHGSSRASHVLGGKGKSKSKSSKKHPHRLTISHGKSGGHKVVHSFEPDESGITQPDEEHIMPDKASLLQHVADNTPDMPAPQAAPPDAAQAGGPAGGSMSVAPTTPQGM